MAAGDIMLTVTPEVLKSKAVSVSGKINAMKNVFESIRTYVNKTNGYWIGEAGNAYRQKYLSKQERIETIFKRLNENVTDLTQMAGVYEEVEKQVLQETESLPADVIV